MSKTAALAQKLGLIRYRNLDGSSRSERRKESEAGGGPENLQFLLVLDFESTCWEDKAFSPPEIIEFPVVLLCLRTGRVLSEFHHYCLPVENPRLSPFCRNLTGITQDQVEAGVPLATCLTLFRAWLTEISRDHGVELHGEETASSSSPNATCLTWSDWDLSFCLENECSRKQLRKPGCLNTWIDIRAVYKQFYNRRPDGLNGALREVGLTFQGREHSGIADARNTASLVWRMVEAGCQLRITATRDLRNTARANTAHRKYEDDEDGPPAKRSKWKHFKPAENPGMMTGKDRPSSSRSSNSNNSVSNQVNKESSKSSSTRESPHTPELNRLLGRQGRTDSGYDSPLIIPSSQPPAGHVDGTPPLCICGRRSRKRQVYKPGPNTGRIFWSCNLRGNNTKAGCRFFLWASTD